MHARLSITAKLALVVIVFALVLLSVVSALAYTSGKIALQTAAESELLSLALGKQASLDNWVTEAQADVTTLAASGSLRAGVEVLSSPGATDARTRLVGELVSYVGARQHFNSLLVLSARADTNGTGGLTEGVVLASTDPRQEGLHLTDRPYFAKAKSELIIQNPYADPAVAGPSMVIAAPVRAADGRAVAVLAGYPNLNSISQIIAPRSVLRQTEDTFLVNTGHLFVTQPRFTTDQVVLQREVHADQIERCLTGTSGAVLADDYRGVPVIAVYRWLPERSMCLITKLDQAEAFAPANRFGLSLVVIGVLALLAAVGLAVMLAHTITRPVLAIQAGAARIGRGELDVHLPETSHDELGLLAHTFNAMAATLVQRQAQLQTYAGQLEQRIAERKQIEVELRQARDDLEVRVRERTAELVQANAILHTEVAERSRAEEALRQASGYNRSLLEASLDPLVTIGPDGHITDVNAATEAVTGRTRAELVGTDFSDYFTEPGRARAGYRQAFREGQVRDYPLEMRHRDGHLTPVLYNASLYRDEAGQVAGVFAAARDVTRIRQAEEQLRSAIQDLRRSNAELEQFAYVASHDLQEPLRMVSSYSQLLARRYKGRLDGDADDFIAYAVDGANRMQRLINDLLTYSRVGTRGKAFQPVDANSALGQAVAALGAAIQENHAVVTNEELPCVPGDDVQLAQLFQNLVGNAIKFHGPEPPRVHVRAQRRGEEWLFAVQDNGVGIAPEYFERIFIIFQRLHGRGEYPGTGIGLAICKKIVERHGGRIWVESEPGRGSTMYFTLPVTAQSVPPGEQQLTASGATAAWSEPIEPAKHEN